MRRNPSARREGTPYLRDGFQILAERAGAGWWRTSRRWRGSAWRSSPGCRGPRLELGGHQRGGGRIDRAVAERLEALDLARGSWAVAMKRKASLPAGLPLGSRSAQRGQRLGAALGCRLPKGNPAGKEAFRFIATAQDPASQVELFKALGNGPVNPAASALVPAELKPEDPGSPENYAKQIPPTPTGTPPTAPARSASIWKPSRKYGVPSLLAEGFLLIMVGLVRPSTSGERRADGVSRGSRRFIPPAATDGPTWMVAQGRP